MDIEYYYKRYFKQYYKKEFDSESILFKDEIISVLNSAYDDLNYLKESKISINQYERDIKTIERKRNELQKFSEKTITLTLPKHPSEVYYLMRNYLVNIYSIDEDNIVDAFKALYDEVFNPSSHRKPKRTKSIERLEDNFYSTTTTLFKIINAMSEKNKNLFKIINAMSEKDKKKIAKKHFDKT